MVLFYPSQVRVASLGIFLDLFKNTYLGGISMLTSALLAGYGLLTYKERYNFLFFIPQWLFVLLTAQSAIFYTVQGHYADGVHRSWQFILLDQHLWILLAIFYIFSMLSFINNE